MEKGKPKQFGNFILFSLHYVIFLNSSAENVLFSVWEKNKMFYLALKLFFSHVGFLPKFVQRLKEINFLREDLIFSIHSVDVSCNIPTTWWVVTPVNLWQFLWQRELLSWCIKLVYFKIPTLIIKFFYEIWNN